MATTKIIRLVIKSRTWGFSFKNLGLISIRDQLPLNNVALKLDCESTNSKFRTSLLKSDLVLGSVSPQHTPHQKSMSQNCFVYNGSKVSIRADKWGASPSVLFFQFQFILGHINRHLGGQYFYVGPKRGIQMNFTTHPSLAEEGPFFTQGSIKSRTQIQASLKLDQSSSQIIRCDVRETPFTYEGTTFQLGLGQESRGKVSSCCILIEASLAFLINFPPPHRLALNEWGRPLQVFFPI